MSSGKRGVGAIIAWVLLLGFTIALATIIFLWMRGQTETMSESTIEYAEGEMQCQNVRINVINITDADPPCSKLEIRNMGYILIDKITVREICNEGGAKSTSNPYIANLAPKSSKTEILGTYKETLSGFCDGTDSCISCNKTEVMPIITIGNRMVGCKDRTIVVGC